MHHSVHVQSHISGTWPHTYNASRSTTNRPTSSDICPLPGYVIYTRSHRYRILQRNQHLFTTNRTSQYYTGLCSGKPDITTAIRHPLRQRSTPSYIPELCTTIGKPSHRRTIQYTISDRPPVCGKQTIHGLARRIGRTTWNTRSRPVNAINTGPLRHRILYRDKQLCTTIRSRQYYAGLCRGYQTSLQRCIADKLSGIFLSYAQRSIIQHMDSNRSPLSGTRPQTYDITLIQLRRYQDDQRERVATSPRR